MRMSRNGRIWQVDARGNILNDADLRHVQAPFRAALDDAVALMVQYAEADIHSIYVTGSVPRGLALPGQSDLHVFAVLEYEVDPELVMQDWIPLAEAEIFDRHDALSDVQIELWPQGYIFRDPEEFSIGAFIIRAHSVCVWGSDLTPELPDFNLNNTHTRIGIANDDLVLLKQDLADAAEAIHDAESAEDVVYWSKFICKRMVRAGFSLVLVESNLYTNDIDLAYEQFSRFYPNQARAMAQAVAYIRQPTKDSTDILNFLATHGSWLLERSEAWLDQYNPDRDEAYRQASEDDAAAEDDEADS